MTTERFIRIFAGAMVLVSLALGVRQSPVFVSGYFLWLTVFVGANLLQSGFTRFCPLEIMLKKAGMKSGGVLN
ncbi:MAG: YgaP family membrane protein [Gammaproteobacteria bacterium]